MLITSVTSDWPWKIFNKLKDLMATKTFIFVGYSLRDSDFREVWEGITKSLGRFAKLATRSIQMLLFLSPLTMLNPLQMATNRLTNRPLPWPPLLTIWPRRKLAVPQW